MAGDADKPGAVDATARDLEEVAAHHGGPGSTTGPTAKILEPVGEAPATEAMPSATLDQTDEDDESGSGATPVPALPGATLELEDEASVLSVKGAPRAVGEGARAPSAARQGPWTPKRLMSKARQAVSLAQPAPRGRSDLFEGRLAPGAAAKEQSSGTPVPPGRDTLSLVNRVMAVLSVLVGLAALWALWQVIR